MQNLLLRNTNQRQTQYQLASYVLIIVMLLGGIQNWWSGVYLRSTATFPVTNIRYMQLRYDMVTRKQLSPVGLTGLGAMGASETLPNIKPINFSNKLGIERKLENDVAYKSVLNDRRCKILDYEKEIRLKKEKLLEQQQVESITCDTADITKVSNMTKEQIGTMLEGTWLEGEEQTLYDVEREAGINAFFVYAVATLESGRGRSTKSMTKNNYYGITVSRSFESYSHNTEYFGGMMNRVYVDKGHTDVNKIGPIYCPPNPDWGNIVSQLMSEQYEKMMDLTVA